MKFAPILILLLFANSNIIKNDSVDEVKLGMDISDFLNTKSPLYQIKKETLNLEGDDYPIFNVYENSELIYAVEPNENGEKVWRIWLYGQRFKTDSGIGVGNTLGDLRNEYTISDISTAEGSIVVFVNEIEVGFDLRVSQVDIEWWNNMNLEELNDNIKIDLIII
ncbi:hypothetical protein [Flagellimonas beolgyonensis]|uniref:hypothetical protein n=1 Tax=Flagellimonas beolgyonensis TaxID=864064 RepID=UPI003D6629C5